MSTEENWGNLFELQTSFKPAKSIEEDLNLPKGPSYTLTLIKPGGWVGFANGVEGKRILMSFFEPFEDTILLAWNGQYRTDIFRVTVGDLDRLFVGWRELKGKYDWMKGG